ncbi:MAG: class II aldolase/adducin family protein [Clostridia bacterium]|nr:class II aldolase/adducin family protein [Clostridia bacterium]
MFEKYIQFAPEGASLVVNEDGKLICNQDREYSFIPGDEKAMVIYPSPFKDKKNFKPSLDDTAQILGPKVKYYDAMPKSLGQNAACFVKDEVVTVGRSLFEAITAMNVLLKSTKVAMLAENIGGAKAISPFEAILMRVVYKKKYSKSEVKGISAKGDFSFSDEELALRQQLVDYGKKLVESGLVQGTWGNLSLRLDDKYMLVTPSGLDYERLTAKDMVKVEIETLNYEGDLKPTSEKGLHGEIYSRRKDVKAVIHTHQTYASVYAAAEKDLSSEVKLAAYGLPGTKGLTKKTADALGNSYGCIMAHHGMVAVGKDLKEAFDICNKIENDCKESLSQE